MGEQEILTGLWECSVCFTDGDRAEVVVSMPLPSAEAAQAWGDDLIRADGREGYVMRVRPTSQMSLL